MRIPQLTGWKNVALIFLVPILLGLKSANDAGQLNSWPMVLLAIKAAFFGGIVQQLVGWFGQESPAAPHVVDERPPAVNVAHPADTKVINEPGAPASQPPAVPPAV